MNISSELQHTVYPVSEYPAIYSDKDNREVDCTGHKFIVRDDTNEILSCMTDEYKIVDNKDVLESALKVLDDTAMKAELSEARVFSGGQRTSWKWIIKGVKVKIANDDYVVLEIRYDNLGLIELEVGSYYKGLTDRIVELMVINKSISFLLY